MNTHPRRSGALPGRLTHAAVSSPLLAGLALVVQPTPATADPPIQDEAGFSESVTLAAGELCDVAVRQDLVYTDRSTTFGDPSRRRTGAHAPAAPAAG